ncbi:hypothetical protein V6N12_028950 [Hibiscus sabdariffa]|uniref:Uncharacterized protein n=1 Tax=Hibiscus sabdariffa TaxID=183260 RepID=A0ABR2F7D4_9ROSI
MRSPGGRLPSLHLLAMMGSCPAKARPPLSISRGFPFSASAIGNYHHAWCLACPTSRYAALNGCAWKEPSRLDMLRPGPRWVRVSHLRHLYIHGIATAAAVRSWVALLGLRPLGSWAVDGSFSVSAVDFGVTCVGLNSMLFSFLVLQVILHGVNFQSHMVSYFRPR